MNSSVTETSAPRVQDLRVTHKHLEVQLSDGRKLSVPVAWSPRLADRSPAERRDWRIIAAGTGIHWPALDEDISVAGLLAGLPSGESATSLKRWLATRRRLPRKVRPTSGARRTLRKSRTGSRLTRG